MWFLPLILVFAVWVAVRVVRDRRILRSRRYSRPEPPPPWWGKR